MRVGSKPAWIALGFIIGTLFLLSSCVFISRVLNRSIIDITVDPKSDLNGAGSNVDSVAFWEAPDPADTLMFVTSKGDPLVEIWPYPFNGNNGQSELIDPCIDSGTNGVIVDQQADLLYVSVRKSDNVCVFTLPDLVWIRTINSEEGYRSEPNLALLHLTSGQTRLYVSDEDVVYIHNPVSGDQIGKFLSPFAGGLEAMAGDDFNQVVYIPDENGRSGIYTFDPDGNPVGGAFGGGGIFDSDEEGIAVYTCPGDGASDNGEGLIIVSDQRSSVNDYEFFDRKTKAYLGKLSITGANNTDGIALTQQKSARYPKGIFAAIDDDTSAVVVGWQTISKAANFSCPETPNS